MRLKRYQQEALDKTRAFMKELALWRDKALANPDVRDFPGSAWDVAGFKRVYQRRKNGLGKPLPNYCFKVPTGGGKTLMAVKSIDAVHELYLRRRTGLVLWVVPSTQIYRQTLAALRDKAHPYRQALDLASANKSLIFEKTDRFSVEQTRNNLCIMMMMLPSANRQSTETLRLFKDNGGFQEFFPAEDAKAQQQALAEAYINLDHFGDGQGLWAWQIKSSLGNVLRLLEPLIIMDEGHKAYSELAKQTLESFNPCMILEFSATPPETANLLVDIPGMDLLAEQMIKLDLHVFSKSTRDWRDTLAWGKERLDSLAQAASKYKAQGGSYIRPICLIQVERTGAEQRESGFIHADDAKEYLVKRMNVAPADIAIKTSEKDELPAVDDENGLLSEGSSIRFIITKQALQEGWDCPFAYVLVVLSNPSARTSMTQLLGRILRQPYARKTGVKELDESYVYCFWQARELMDTIREGFKKEGMGDLQARVNASTSNDMAGLKTAVLRQEFNSAVSRPILPVFVNRQNKPVRFESDILASIDWDKIDVGALEKLPLDMFEAHDTEIIATLDMNPAEAVRRKTLAKSVSNDEQKVSPVLLAQQWLDHVPNPWRAFGLAKQVLDSLTKVFGAEAVRRNFVNIAAEGRQHLEAQVECLAEQAFRAMLKKDELRFVLITKNFAEGGSVFPETVSYSAGSRRLRDENDEEVQKSLFDYVPEDEFNDTERDIALFLEKQERMFFWYRNRSQKDYGIQGWRRHRIYPDFIFTTTEKPDKDFDRVYVMETKGEHLWGNDKTQYLQNVLNLCTEQVKPTSRTELGLKWQGKVTRYEVLPEKEWQTRLIELLDGEEKKL